MDLNKTRERIDQIDDQIARLYNERMCCVKDVAEAKKESGKLVNDPDREKSIISRVTKMVDSNLMVYTKQVFETLFETSKSYQKQFLNFSSPTVNKIDQILNMERCKLPITSQVACQGTRGAYSEKAAEGLFSLPNITFFKTFDKVFQAVESGFCQYGILPIENSSVGSVNAVYDLMKEHKFYIVKDIKLKVSHSLLANKGVKLENVKEIVSHEQAINQCRMFLRERDDIKITICENTAVAARYVFDSNRNDIGAISSKDCADTYNLDVLANNIQDNDNNYTRFICISKNLQIFKGASKISFMTTLPHTPGSLYKTLGKFAVLGLNVAKLESRPIPQSNFDFMFYFDFDGDIEEIELRKLIAEMENSSEDFTFLGAYSEVLQWKGFVL